MKTKNFDSKELLGKFYQVDEENRVVSVQLFFDNFSQLIDQSFGDFNVEKLNSTLFDAVESAFKEIPLRYQIQFNLHFKDLENYTISEIERVLEVNLEMKFLIFKNQDKRKKIGASVMTVFGASIIAISYFTGGLVTLPQIFTDVINIAGTLIVWEAAYLFFLERGETRRLHKQYLRKLKGITVTND